MYDENQRDFNDNKKRAIKQFANLIIAITVTAAGLYIIHKYGPNIIKMFPQLPKL